MANQIIGLTNESAYAGDVIHLVKGMNKTYGARFVIERYQAGVDLNTLVWSVNMRAANNALYYDPVTVSEYDDNAIYIDWVITNAATLARGTTFYTVEGKTAGDDAPVWRSTIHSIDVSEAVDAGEIYEGADEDAVEQLILELRADMNTALGNTVHYNAADNKTDTEKMQARSNIDAASKDEVQQVQDSLNAVVNKQTIFVETAQDLQSQYYKSITPLSTSKTYLIRLTVAEAGLYALRFGTNTSLEYMVDTLGPVTVQANVPYDFVGYTPSQSNFTKIRLPDASNCNIDIYEIINIEELLGDTYNIWPAENTFTFTQNRNITGLSIPIGDYVLSARITSSDVDATTCLVAIRSADKPDGAVASTQMSRGSYVYWSFHLDYNCNEVRFFASKDSGNSSGDTVTFENVMLVSGSNIKLYAPSVTSVDYVSRDAAKNVSDIVDAQKIGWIDGYYLSMRSGTVALDSRVQNSVWRYAVVPCQEGDQFTVSGSGEQPILWGFIDNTEPTHNVIMSASAGATEENLIITAPQNAAYLILNNKLPETRDSYVGITTNGVYKYVRSFEHSDTKIAFFGDSIVWSAIKTENTAGTSFVISQANPSLPGVISTELHCTVDNYGVSGAGYKVAPSGGMNIYDYIQTIDLSTYTHVMILAGDNDSSVGETGIGTYQDTTGDTVMGQIYLIMTYLHEEYPQIIPVICHKINKIALKTSPAATQTVFGSFPNYYYGYTYGGTDGFSIAKLHEEIDKFCEHYHVCKIDYKDFCMGGWQLQEMVGPDMTHFSQYGYNVLGKYLAGQMQRLIG